MSKELIRHIDYKLAAPTLPTWERAALRAARVRAVQQYRSVALASDPAIPKVIRSGQYINLVV